MDARLEKMDTAMAEFKAVQEKWTALGEFHFTKDNREIVYDCGRFMTMVTLDKMLAKAKELRLWYNIDDGQLVFYLPAHEIRKLRASEGLENITADPDSRAGRQKAGV